MVASSTATAARVCSQRGTPVHAAGDIDWDEFIVALGRLKRALLDVRDLEASFSRFRRQATCAALPVHPRAAGSCRVLIYNPGITTLAFHGRRRTCRTAPAR